MDARAYSTADNSTLRQAEVNALEPLQYWAQYDLGDGLGEGTNTTLKLGQQRMLLGSARLINNPLFRNTANTYLGLRGDIKRGNTDGLTAFYMLPTRILPDDIEGYYDNRIEIDRNGFDLQLAGAFYHRKVADLNLELYAYYLGERDSSGFQTRDRRLLTPGMRIYREPKRGKLDFELEGILQRGKARRTAAATDLVDKDVRAFYLYGELGYRLDNAIGPRFAVSATYGSGQDESDKITRFDQLFGAIFPDYAPPGLYGPTTLSNVSSFGADVIWTPGKWTIWNTFRRLRAPEPNDVFGRTGIRNGPNGEVGDQFFHPLHLFRFDLRILRCGGLKAYGFSNDLARSAVIIGLASGRVETSFRSAHLPPTLVDPPARLGRDARCLFSRVRHTCGGYGSPTRSVIEHRRHRGDNTDAADDRG